MTSRGATGAACGPTRPPSRFVATVATVGLLAALVVSAAACVGPAPTFGSYEGKAGATAKDMLSAVESALLAVRLAGEHRAYGPYLTQTIADAERDATAIQGAFDSIQPPDGRADRLRDRLDGLLQQAVSTLQDLRIAIRRGDIGSLPRIGTPLPGLSQKLDDFSTAYPSEGR